MIIRATSIIEEPNLYFFNSLLVTLSRFVYRKFGALDKFLKRHNNMYENQGRENRE